MEENFKRRTGGNRSPFSYHLAVIQDRRQHDHDDARKVGTHDEVP